MTYDPFENCCELCGESLTGEEDIGEMYGEETPRYGNPEYGTTTSGRVHAQCGLDQGWSIA